MFGVCIHTHSKQWETTMSRASKHTEEPESSQQRARPSQEMDVLVCMWEGFVKTVMLIDPFTDRFSSERRKRRDGANTDTDCVGVCVCSQGS